MRITFFGIVTDCDCANAAGRQSLRVQSLFGVSPQIIGARTDLTAAGNIVDALDAVRCGVGSGIVLGNVAPRDGCRDQWPNGTPFGYVYVERTLVVTTIAGRTLSLVKKLALADVVHIFDIPAVMNWAMREELIVRPEAERVERTQFRSFEFSPRVARWIADGHKVPSRDAALARNVPDVAPSVWYVDHPFGNCKTTLLPHERHATRFADLPFTEHLADVPPNQLSWVVGSSGFSSSRWLELVVNGASAAEKLSLKAGDSLV